MNNNANAMRIILAQKLHVHAKQYVNMFASRSHIQQ